MLRGNVLRFVGHYSPCLVSIRNSGMIVEERTSGISPDFLDFGLVY